jgi:uncharacterized protein YukE
MSFVGHSTTVCDTPRVGSAMHNAAEPSTDRSGGLRAIRHIRERIGMSALLETPSDMHAIAARIRGSAEQLRAHAARLDARSAAVHWHSPAAGRFRGEVTAMTRRIHAAASHLDAAAHRLDRHAELVRERQRLLTAPEHAAGRLAARAAHALGL